MNIEALMNALWKQQGKVSNMRLHAEADGNSDYHYYDGMFEGLEYALKVIEKMKDSNA
jgi:pantothenate kinase